MRLPLFRNGVMTMKRLMPFQRCLTSIFLFLILIYCPAYAEQCDDKGAIYISFHKLLIDSEPGSSVEIDLYSMEAACDIAIDFMEIHDYVVEYELPIEAPDKRLVCIPFLSAQPGVAWQFLAIIREKPDSRIVLQNLPKEEFQQLAQEMYDISIYHFEPYDF